MLNKDKQKTQAAKLKGCVHYIFACLFSSLNKNPSQTRKNVFIFTSKTLSVLKKIEF